MRQKIGPFCAVLSIILLIVSSASRGSVSAQDALSPCFEKVQKAEPAGSNAVQIVANGPCSMVVTFKAPAVLPPGSKLAASFNISIIGFDATRQSMITICVMQPDINIDDGVLVRSGALSNAGFSQKQERRLGNLRSTGQFCLRDLPSIEEQVTTWILEPLGDNPPVVTVNVNGFLKQ